MPYQQKVHGGAAIKKIKKYNYKLSLVGVSIYGLWYLDWSAFLSLWDNMLSVYSLNCLNGYQIRCTWYIDTISLQFMCIFQKFLFIRGSHAVVSLLFWQFVYVNVGWIIHVQTRSCLLLSATWLAEESS